MAISKAFIGHGIFTEMSVTYAIDHYATYVSPNPANPPPKDNIDRFINALRDMHIAYVWIHLFSRGIDNEAGADGSPELRVALIKRLNAANIPWAGWGYCGGATRDDDLALIKQFANDPQIALSAFVIDSEPEKNKDEWPDTATFETFVAAVETKFSRDNVAISSWPVLYLHEDDKANTLMQAAARHVSAFAPQVYWLDKPLPSNYDADYTERDYPLHDPLAFVRLCLDDWSKYLTAWKRADARIAAQLIVSGMTYWGEDNSPPLPIMEAKLENVVTNLPPAQWGRMIGFNWYHAGKPSSPAVGTMSSKMITSITNAKMQLKPFQTP
jgi:hypothetical protein